MSSLLHIFFACFSHNVLAQINISNSDLSREIEKSLLFDSETTEKFDVYNNEYGSNLVAEPTLGNADKEDQKKYTPEEMDIVMVDRVKVDKDIREKEKLAYNSVLVGQYEIALELYKEILQKEPKNKYVKYSLAVVYQRLYQFKQAKKIYYELLKDEPENKQEVINNIIAIMIEESPREAVYMLSRLTMQNSQSAHLFASLGNAYEKISNFDLAIQNYFKAYQLDNQNPSYAYNLGVLYDKNKEYEKAIEMYVNAINNAQYSKDNQIASDSVKMRIEKLKLMI
ncbi:MAG: tetratricopeptide repeat protein [Alphaproteobacteria bacterium]